MVLCKRVFGTLDVPEKLVLFVLLGLNTVCKCEKDTWQPGLWEVVLLFVISVFVLYVFLLVIVLKLSLTMWGQM